MLQGLTVSCMEGLLTRQKRELADDNLNIDIEKSQHEKPDLHGQNVGNSASYIIPLTLSFLQRYSPRDHPL